MNDAEERDVIRRVLAGDADAFEQLVHEHEKLVYNLSLRMLGDEQDAMDASQEAFFRAYRALGDFRGRSKFSVWLYSLTANICRDMLRQRGRTALQTSLTDEEGEDLVLPDDALGPQELLEQKELRQTVRDGLARLEPGFREALVLRELNGLTYEEIAAVMGLESGTVKSRIFRARRKLADILMTSGNFSGRGPSKSSGKGGADR